MMDYGFRFGAGTARAAGAAGGLQDAIPVSGFAFAGHPGSGTI